ALLVAAPGQHDFAAERAAELDPALLRPQLVLAAGHGQENEIGAGNRSLLARVQAILERAAVAVAERRGGEAAIALDRVQALRHRVAHVVEPRGERLPRARAVEPMFRAVRRGTDQRALEQALRVDDRVIGLLAQRAAEAVDLGPYRRAP